MDKLALIATTFVVLCSVAPAEAEPPMPQSVRTSNLAHEVALREQAWSTAEVHHDPDAISKILADDFVGIDGRGAISDKAAELEEAKPPAASSSAERLVGEELSEIRVRIYGDTAVLTALNTARFESKGTESTIRYRRTTVWVKRDGAWQCVSFHGSRVR